jgi:hypothetical protein
MSFFSMGQSHNGGQIDLSIILVNWNTKSMLQACLGSLLDASFAIQIEVFVVDNASSDGSPDMVTGLFPKVTLITNADNLGFAAANNQAARLATGSYLLFLNPDTLVPKNSLHKMMAYADTHPECGILGPRLLNPDHSLQRSCWPNYPGLGMAFSDALYLWKVKWLPPTITNEYRPSQLHDVQNVAHLLGACLLVRREAWQDAGPFDETYFMYMEETSLCYRASQKGWMVVYFPDAEIIHYGQRSSRQIPESSLSHYYTSYYRFCKTVRGYTTFQLALLRMVMKVAVWVRMGLWKWRQARASTPQAGDLSKNMLAGYQAALRTIQFLA